MEHTDRAYIGGQHALEAAAKQSYAGMQAGVLGNTIAGRTIDKCISEAANVRGQIYGAVSAAQAILNRLSGDDGHAENEAQECCDKPAGALGALADAQGDSMRGLAQLHRLMEQIGRMV